MPDYKNDKAQFWEKLVSRHRRELDDDKARFGHDWNAEPEEYADDKPRNAGEWIADKWRNLPKAAKIGIPAGGTALAVGVTGVGLANTEHEENISPQDLQEGKLDYSKGETALTDVMGKPALLNYFIGQEKPVLEVSLATQLPDLYQEGRVGGYLGRVQNNARSSTLEVRYVPVTTCTSNGNGGQSCSTHLQPQYYTDYHYYNYPLEIEKDFVPANQEQEAQVRAFFENFTKATGIPVNISTNNPDAHITIANYRNEPDSYRGSLDYVRPGALNSTPPGSTTGEGPAEKRGFLILNDRNGGAANGIGDQIAKLIGFESGTANWLSLREQLVAAGQEVPALNPGDSLYDLAEDLPKHALLPDQVIADNSGVNTLQGSPENDTLVTEPGYCGRIDTPKNQFINIFSDGKQYCIAEGEFSLVKGGDGNDLIFASRSGEQTIDPGAGNDRIAFFQPEIGDKTILSGEGENTLYLSDELVAKGDLKSAADGDDLVLHFTAFSGRELGTIRLVDQLVPGQGINAVTVVDAEGQTVFSMGVKDLTAESWQRDAVEPMVKQVESKGQGEAQDLAARMGRRNRLSSELLARGRSSDGGMSL